MRMVPVALMAAVLTGCAGVQPIRPAANLDACASGAGLPGDLAAPGGVILFGEIHGVKELPWFFGETVCSTAKAGVPVAVGLEIPESEQASVDAFLHSSGRPGDSERLLQGAFWTRQDQDGRASQARLDLLDRLRRLSASGLPIRVFLFDPIAYGSAAERDRGMASRIAGEARDHSDELVLALVGDVHAWTTKGSPWDKEFVPMGWYLKDSGVKFCSLGRSTPAGTAWTCKGSPMICGPGDVPPFLPLADGQAGGIQLLDSPTTRGYEGVYAVSTLTASAPAAPPQRR